MRNTEMFTKTIVKKPGNSLINGITTANLGSPDILLAKEQHEAYIQCLINCGVEVVILETEEANPDSVFIEDTAIVTDKVAIITRPYFSSRQSETPSVEKTLVKLFGEVEKISAPGTVEGGDVMRIGKTFYIGMSERTNDKGAEQLISILTTYGYKGIKVSMHDLLHLKTGISYLGNNTILMGQELAKEKLFEAYEIISVDHDESYAANCIRVNDYVIFAAGYPKTRQKIIDAGFKLKELEMSEFRKLDGGLSCLSLRF